MEDRTGDVEDFKECVYKLREELNAFEPRVKGLMKHEAFKTDALHPDRQGEMRANIMLAYRHLEDLRMRLGKAIQAYDGGKSVYPR